ncbi:MAG: protein kinase [Myxococcales bacterium]|nr:protein kinase [Myxococcales bacterium]
MIAMVFELGVGAALGWPLLKVAAKSGPKVVGALHQHFFQHNEVLGQAWVESYGKGMRSLAEGVGYTSALGKLCGLMRSQVQGDFNHKIQTEYLEAFQEETKLPAEQIKRIRKAAEEILQKTSSSANAIYPKEKWPKEMEISRLFSTAAPRAETSRTLIKEVLSQDYSHAALKKYQVSPEQIEQLFLFRELLLTGVLYFFREHLLKEPYVRAALELLQKEGISADVQQLGDSLAAQRSELEEQRKQQAEQVEQQRKQHIELQSSLQDLEKQLGDTQAQLSEAIQTQNFAILAQLGAQAQQIQATKEEQHLALAKITQQLAEQNKQLGDIESSLERIEKDNQRFQSDIKQELEEAKALWSDFDQELNGFGEKLGDLRKELKEDILTLTKRLDGWQTQNDDRLRSLETLIAKLIEIMGAHGLPDRQVTIAHEMTVYPKHTDIEIEQAYKKWQKLLLNTNHPYAVTSLRMGTSLSSMGSLKAAEECFETVARQAQFRMEAALDKQEFAQAREDLALAQHNLYQIYLRQGALERGLEALKEAVRLEPSTYMPFNMNIYEVQRILGAGGMGCAFLCQHALNKKHVVVKTFWKAKEGTLQQVFSEAFQMQDADPDGVFIPRPLDIGYGDPLHAKRPFLVMEYIEGSLDGEQYLEKYGPLSFKEAVRLGSQVAEALTRAHQRGICHFDLKPANLLFYKDGRDWSIKIIDFGLARAAHSLRDDLAKQHSRSSQRSVLANTAFGTMVYAPPEQLNPTPQQQPGPASDIYSFAKTLYRLMTGQEAQHFLPPRELQGVELIDMIARCLSMDMKQRPTAAELKERFDAMNQGRPEPVNPAFYKMASQFMQSGTLYEHQESLLWTVLQGFSTPRPLGRDALRWSLEQAHARRNAAQRAEGWLVKQQPSFYPTDQIWSALQGTYPEDYTEQGLREVEQTEIIDVFRDDPAFVEEEKGIRLIQWKPPFGSVAPTPSEFVELTVGQWVAQFAWSYRVWVRPMRENEDKMRRSNEYVRMPLDKYRELFAMKKNGNFRVDSFCEKIAEICGWPVVVLDEKGQKAEPQVKIAQLRLSGAKVFSCGDDVFFTLAEGKDGQPPKWLLNKVLRSSLLGVEGGRLKECAPKFRLLTERGEVTAYFNREKEKLRALGGLWDLYPELSAGDALCFHVSEPEICRVYVISQSALEDRPLPAKPSEESVQARAALLAAYEQAKAAQAPKPTPPSPETVATTAQETHTEASETSVYSTPPQASPVTEISEEEREDEIDGPDEGDDTGNEEDGLEGDGPDEINGIDGAVDSTTSGQDISLEPTTSAPKAEGGDKAPPLIAPIGEGLGEDEDEEIAPLTVSKKVLEWAVDWGYGWRSLIPKPTSPPRPTALERSDVETATSKRDLADRQSKSQKLPQAGSESNGAQTSLVGQRRKTCCGPRDIAGQSLAPKLAMDQGSWGRLFITLRPSSSRGTSPSWRTYGYLFGERRLHSSISRRE